MYTLYMHWYGERCDGADGGAGGVVAKGRHERPGQELLPAGVEPLTFRSRARCLAAQATVKTEVWGLLRSRGYLYPRRLTRVGLTAVGLTAAET